MPTARCPSQKAAYSGVLTPSVVKRHAGSLDRSMNEAETALAGGDVQRVVPVWSALADSDVKPFASWARTMRSLPRAAFRAARLGGVRVGGTLETGRPTLGGPLALDRLCFFPDRPPEPPTREPEFFAARFPSLSWKNIANLSGGEKTLSSLALVFALHHFKPTPLYVMDEIDAALDFENVSIVASYIKERTKNAHLRNNMFELADRLVGIYKTHNITKSVTINPKECLQLHSAAAAAAARAGQE
eukprot:g11438.t1